MDKFVVLSLRNSGKTLQEIGNQFGVSRQRVHQVLGYYPAKAHVNDATYKSLRQKKCADCGRESECLHHLDRDSQNNNRDNLLPLCIRCHYKTHKEINRSLWSRKYRSCVRCGTRNYPHDTRGLCTECYRVSRLIPRFEWSRYYERCINCSTKKILYKANGMCSVCYGRFYARKYYGYKKFYK